MRVADGQNLRIAEAGTVLMLDYTGALAAHRGESWFGVALAFRMLQSAGDALSKDALWDREGLFVVSAHPGNGVRDAVEYVTRCVSRGRYRVDEADRGCRRDMRFAWEVGDKAAVVAIRLRDEHVPKALLDLLDRLGTTREREHDARDCVALKHRLAEQVWEDPLDQLFEMEMAQTEGARRA